MVGRGVNGVYRYQKNRKLRKKSEYTGHTSHLARKDMKLERTGDLGEVREEAQPKYGGPCKLV